MTGQTDLRDIADRDDISRLVIAFYRQAFADDLLGPVFTDIAQLDLSTHLPVMCDFWETVLLRAGLYHRNALQPHARLNKQVRLSPAHFERWLSLWGRTVDERHRGAKAELAKTQAARIAASIGRRLGGAPATGRGTADARRRGDGPALETARERPQPQLVTLRPPSSPATQGGGVRKISLDTLASELLDTAAAGGRASRTLHGGHDHTLRQTLIGLPAGQSLAEHDNPGEATLYVLRGRVRLHVDDEAWEARHGDMLILPDARHSLDALDDTVVLLTVARTAGP
jgi:hemoglobin